jgi:hypothetical protein
MLRAKYVGHGVLGVIAVVFAGAQMTPDVQRPGPVLTAAVGFVAGRHAVAVRAAGRPERVAASVSGALGAFTGVVRPLSDARALGDAFHSYFAYKAAHPDDVRKPYLYFVDYGLPSTTPRGYVFDMDSLRVVEGPFAVAHGRGSSESREGIPTRFSNASGSAATSLGLYLAQETYDFHGHAGGRAYGAVGLRLMGLSSGFNDNARARRVVAHGAPYVTETTAGRSEGCPAMEPARAARLLPKLGNGGLVFLFAPDQRWLARDPWVTGDVG